MKSDKYIKFLLTVIAINLTLVTLNNFGFIPSAYAQSRPQRVAIYSPDGSRYVDIQRIGGGKDALTVYSP